MEQAAGAALLSIPISRPLGPASLLAPHRSGDAQAKGRDYYDGDVNLPSFITAKNLKPFIPEELFKTSSQIEFRTLRGNIAFGYAAELLPRVCGVFLDAKGAGAWTPPR